MPTRSRTSAQCGSRSTRITSGPSISCATTTRSRSSRRLREAEPMIKVQRKDFDVGAELEKLAKGNPRIGGVASFIGLARDMGGSAPAADRVEALTLEHYP